ncbi:hypothetical protein Y032_0152g2875 [Ancylostoma ceylanicum]|uniref:Uncharacterized protein n=1 Tax=Ancylostoma ceylanicum TaxID=53326 RepID=A0A016T0Y4_9BILA|nr:hypothetical protein Y032_0152g2875 [Ancylostoma ceylanicum]
MEREWPISNELMHKIRVHGIQTEGVRASLHSEQVAHRMVSCAAHEELARHPYAEAQEVEEPQKVPEVEAHVQVGIKVRPFNKRRTCTGDFPMIIHLKSTDTL